MIVIDSSVNKDRDRRVLEDIETRLAGVQSKSFNTETNIATEKIFDVASAAPRVIPANIMVVSAKHGAALTGTLHNVHQRRIRSEFGVGESIGAPQIHIPFAIAIPCGTWWRRNPLHFFICIFVRTGNLAEVTEPRGYGRFSFAVFATKEPGKGDKHVSHRRVVRATEQG